jgi:predicted DCC family thiol-disulfide oxidoreductase YuxK
MGKARPVPADGQPVRVDLPAGGPVILFDGVCNLCSGFVRFVIARDRDGVFRFVPAQSALGSAILRDLGMSTDEYESNVLICGGRAWFKSEAYIRIAGRLRQPWPLMRLARLCPRPLRDWIYDLIAANRYAWFGRRESCLVPDPAIVRRFLG